MPPKYRKGKKTARVSKAVKKYVKEKVETDPELKMQEATLNAGSMPNGGDINPSVVPLFNILFNGIQQGSNEAQRIAQQIVIKYIEIKFGVISSDDTLSDGLVRFLLFRDRAANNLPPDYPLLLNSGIVGTIPVSTLNIESTNQHMPKRFMKDEKRYTIMWDKTTTLHNGGGSTNQSLVKYITFRTACNFKTQYTSSGLLIDDIISNSLYFAAWSNTDSARFTDFSYKILYTDA